MYVMLLAMGSSCLWLVKFLQKQENMDKAKENNTYKIEDNLP